VLLFLSLCPVHPLPLLTTNNARCHHLPLVCALSCNLMFRKDRMMSQRLAHFQVCVG